MSSTPDEHKASAPEQVRCAVVTISDTRTLETDTGGALLIELLTGSGHSAVARELIPDDAPRINALLDNYANDPAVQAVLLTGGTGITARDQTYETVTARLTRSLPGYGELFRMLSYQEIGAATMLSRAVGGLIGTTVVLTMPGSRNAVRLAMEQVILPELTHLVREANR